jgi:GNAT superfamily N-acetyltransferase
MSEWRFEQLDSSHERGEFCCGKAPLDDFLRHYASQYAKRGVGRTYVAVRPTGKRVWGYYTLAAGSVAFEQLPAAAAKKLPKHPVPVALLGRLAVDQGVQGQGLGGMLLTDALKRCLGALAHIGIHAVEVLAIDQQAKQFYLKYGFVPLLDDEHHLYLPMRTVEKLFE